CGATRRPGPRRADRSAPSPAPRRRRGLRFRAAPRSRRRSLDAGGRRRRRRRRREMTRDQGAHRIRRLRAFLDPEVHALLVDLHHRRLAARVVVAEDFDERTVAGGTGIGDDNAEERTLLGSRAAQTNDDHLSLLLNALDGSTIARWLRCGFGTT